MKKLFASLLVATTLLTGSATTQAQGNECDCQVETITYNKHEYAFAVMTIEGTSGHYVKLKSTINGETDYYYKGYFVHKSEIKSGNEVVILYDNNYKIYKIIAVDND